MIFIGVRDAGEGVADKATLLFREKMSNIYVCHSSNLFQDNRNSFLFMKNLIPAPERGDIRLVTFPAMLV